MSDYFSNTTIYSIPFVDAAIASSVGPWDLIAVLGTTSGRWALREINIGQKSSSPAGNQQLDVRVITGVTGTTASGSSLPVNNLKGWAAAPPANSLAFGPSTALVSTGSASLLISDNSDLSGNWEYAPEEKHMFVQDVGETLVLRVGQPAVPVTLNGYMIIEELPLRG